MELHPTYEKYPSGYIAAAVLVQLSIYILGGYLIFLVSQLGLLLFVLFILVLEIRLLKYRCAYCYYYEKYCAFGKGMLCSFFFKKGNPALFSTKHIKWTDILPDFLVSIIPLVLGIYLVIVDSSWILLLPITLLLVLAFPASGYLRGTAACRYCKQRMSGCPAEQFFQKSNVKKQ